MKKLIILLTLLGFALAGFSQKALIKKAQSLEEKMKFADAVTVYEHVDEKWPADSLKLKIAHCYKKLNEPEKVELWYKKVEDKGSMKPEDHFYYAQVLLMDGHVEEAHKWFEVYEKEAPKDLRASREIQSLDHLKDYYKDSSKYLITNLTLNSEESDFGPCYYHSGLLFVSNRKTEHSVKHEYAYDHSAYLDIFLAPFDTINVGEYLEAKRYDTKINTKYHEGPLTFDKNYTRVIFTRNNYHHGHATKSKEGKIVKLELFEGERINGKWDNIHKLVFESDEFSYAHPTISPDHKTLVFASDMPGGFGGTDLYKSTWQGDHWSKPRNLGSDINTEGNEREPFLHEDGTLYFSSDGHGGIGGLDIYESVQDRGRWTDPKDMGYPINTHMDDFGIIISNDKKDGYFASNRKGGKGKDDIYHFELQGLDYNGTALEKVTKKVLPNVDIDLIDERGAIVETVKSDSAGKFALTLILVEGHSYKIIGKKEDHEDGLIDISETQITAANNGGLALPTELLLDSIRIIMKGHITGSDTQSPLDSVTVIIHNKTDDVKETIITGADGAFEFLGLRDKEYEISASHIGYFAASKTASSEGIDHSKTVYLDMSLILEKIQVKAKIEIENVYYDYNSAEIRKDAALELDKLIKTMKDNPTMKIELSSHSDSKGQKSYNQRLSQRRAQSAVNYLIESGIDKTRLVAKGYGEEQLLNHCKDGVECSDEEHAKNRRTEVEVLDFEEVK